MVKSQTNPVAALLFLVPQAALAQSEQKAAAVIGLAVGRTQLPEQLVETCGGNSRTFSSVEVKAGVARGHWSVESRAAAFGALSTLGCLTIGTLHESGMHTDRVNPYDRGHGDASLAAHVSYTTAARFISLGIGAGRLLKAEAPYLSVGGMLRTPGRFAFVLEAQSNWTRLRSDIITAEWTQFERTRVITSSSDHAWHGTYATRFGVEWRLH